jgi:hypothetical protein
MVEEHKLCIGEVVFTLDRELIAPMGNLGSFEFLHGEL